jgi:hypothetical protein
MHPIDEIYISDLAPGDLVRILCACGHSGQLTVAMLATARVDPNNKVVDLKDQFRCPQCDEKLRGVLVSVQWAN